MNEQHDDHLPNKHYTTHIVMDPKDKNPDLIVETSDLGQKQRVLRDDNSFFSPVL